MNIDSIIITLSFLVCWPLGAYLFWRWDIGGYRSEYENREAQKDQQQ